MDTGIRNYLTVTGGYWAFTVTDGAIRMLVVLYFHQLGYSLFEVAMLFLFYEIFGILTNLVGGWLGARIGLNLTMHIGMAMQVFALAMLTVPDAWLSTARFFLFGARDVWFVVGLPVFLSGVLGWSHTQVGGFLAIWVIGYGFVQATAPELVRRSHQGRGPGGGTARLGALILAVFPAGIAVALVQGLPPGPVLVVGLIPFGIVFAINSAVHSYLILA
jgi:hypothetical protein